MGTPRFAVRIGDVAPWGAPPVSAPLALAARRGHHSLGPLTLTGLGRCNPPVGVARVRSW